MKKTESTPVSSELTSSHFPGLKMTLTNATPRSRRDKEPIKTRLPKLLRENDLYERQYN